MCGLLAGGICVQGEQQDARVLRRQVLDSVEAADVRLQRFVPGAERDRAMQADVPECLHSLPRIRQHSTGPVHGFPHPNSQLS
ncbi:unnamed protein product [Linum tenue]|uniref:Uncharacterized protein n=1 Tax=Linum tenue TaxID=586396 RepID=A0AAV0R761_9ROSI|nr:unnamed protein product [Linum tenue]